MSKSKIFKEEFFNSETNEKFNKIHLQLDPTHEDLSPFLRFLNSLADFQSKWVEKEGGIPEELDKRCINMLGLRFALLVPTLFEVYMRLQLFKGGAIDSHLQYIPEMECGGQKFQISKHEHEEICVNLNALVNSADNLHLFLDSLADFKI